LKVPKELPSVCVSRREVIAAAHLLNASRMPFVKSLKSHRIMLIRYRGFRGIRGGRVFHLRVEG
jgi:hypothetical protein